MTLSRAEHREPGLNPGFRKFPAGEQACSSHTPAPAFLSTPRASCPLPPEPDGPPRALLVANPPASLPVPGWPPASGSAAAEHEPPRGATVGLDALGAVAQGDKTATGREPCPLAGPRGYSLGPQAASGTSGRFPPKQKDHGAGGGWGAPTALLRSHSEATAPPEPQDNDDSWLPALVDSHSTRPNDEQFIHSFSKNVLSARYLPGDGNNGKNPRSQRADILRAPGWLVTWATNS